MNTIREIKNEIEKENGVEININTLYTWIRDIELKYNIKPTFKPTQKNEYLYKYYASEDAQKIKDIIEREYLTQKDIVTNTPKTITTKEIVRELKKAGVQYKNYCTYSAKISQVRKELGIEPIRINRYRVQVFYKEDGEKIIEEMIHINNKSRIDKYEQTELEISTDNRQEDYSKAITILDDIINENKKLKENNETLLHELRIIKTKNKELAEEVEELKKQKDTGLIQRLLKLRG